jgi:hypothetical protein
LVARRAEIYQIQSASFRASGKEIVTRFDLDVAVTTTGDGTARKLLKAVEEFYTYIERNRAFIPNYGER